ncbi:MAG: biotin/lipoyl-binding protein, partial [Cyanobacteria bacterium J083]
LQTIIALLRRLSVSQIKAESSSFLEISQPFPLEAIAALGRLEPEGEVINLSAPAFIEGARVEKLLVRLGEKVKFGQVVAILDSHERLQAALKGSQTQVQVAQARVAKIQAGAKIGEIEAQTATIQRLEAELQGQITAQQATIERLEAELNNATTECDRYQKLYQAGAISASEHDNMCLKQNIWQERLKEAKATRQRTVATLIKQIAEARATLNKIAEVRPVDLAVAKAELEAAKAEVRQAQANLNLAYVRAPQAGQILKIHTLPGEIISDKGIVAIGQTQQMYAIAEVYETDISKVRLGQRAIITSKGFTGELGGNVAEIGLQIGKKDVLGTDPAADVDSRVVEVKIHLDPVDSQRVTGLTNLQVNVVIHLTESSSK